MSSSVRATATVIGRTIWHRRPAEVEWTPDRRLRITVIEAGTPPQVLFDGPPEAIARVHYARAGQHLVTFVPRRGRRIRTDLTGSARPQHGDEHPVSPHGPAIAPPAPPPNWWVDLLTHHGVETSRYGWGTQLGIPLAFIAAMTLLGLLVARLG